MSTPVIIGLVALLLSILVAVAITLQTIEKNNKEKRRLEAALKTRARNFQYMLDGFPDRFLNKDLKLLVCRCLQEIFGQLMSINPKNSSHGKNKKHIEQQLETIKQQPDDTAKVHLTDPAQIKETQTLLQSLYGFIGKLKKNQNLSNEQATVYAQQVRTLMLQTTLDAFTNGVNDSLSKRKPRLAIHYIHMIIEKLNKENAQGQYTEMITQHKQQMAELEKEAVDQDQRKKEISEEWDAAPEDDTTWKKNVVYD